MFNPHAITAEFEKAICEYTGSPFCVTTTSCTQAILMALTYARKCMCGKTKIILPKYTYVGVVASVLNAGHDVDFTDIEWEGEYQLYPLYIFDSARRFTSGMYQGGAIQCVSFHWQKILGLSQGGAILLNNKHAYEWLKRARFDGRTEGIDPKKDQVQYPSWHAYLSPEVAAHGLMKLSLLPKHNADLPRSDYPDLSEMEAFK